jgi:hypothetical protein
MKGVGQSEGTRLSTAVQQDGKPLVSVLKPGPHFCPRTRSRGLWIFYNIYVWNLPKTNRMNAVRLTFKSVYEKSTTQIVSSRQSFYSPNVAYMALNMKILMCRHSRTCADMHRDCLTWPMGWATWDTPSGIWKYWCSTCRKWAKNELSDSCLDVIK